MHTQSPRHGCVAKAPLTLTLLIAAILGIMLVACPVLAHAETMDESAAQLEGTSFDRADAYEADDETDATLQDELSTQSSLQPLSVSSEMLYFCKYESSQNYDQGLSSGDGYHAMGYFQFDNRYGLGKFLEAVYEYNPTKYWQLKQIGDWYDWNTYGNGGNVTGVTSPGGSWTMADDLNWSWHQAYADDPTEFSNLQNAWAYQSYYEPAASYLATKGITLSSFADCDQGMCWGMCNLFGSSGWRKWADGAGLSSSMSDAEFASSLANYLIAAIGNGTYSYTYGSSYVNRYRNELSDCLDYLGYDISTLASNNAGTVSNGTYTLRLGSNTAYVLDVSGGSTASGANVQLYGANGSDAQSWTITNVGGGYVTIANAGSGKLLDVKDATLRQGTNVQQWPSNGNKAQLWVPVRQSDGSITFYSALGQGLVLDISGGTAANGSNVQVWADNGSSAQGFYLTTSTSGATTASISEGCYTVSAGTGNSQVLDVPGASLSSGTSLQTYSSNGSLAQHWYVRSVGSGIYTLQNVGSGLYLSCSGSSVSLSSSSTSASTRWLATSSNGGTSQVCLTSAQSGLALDVLGASSKSGSKVQGYASNGSKAQSWSFSSTSLVGNGTYTFRPTCATSMRLDVSGGVSSNGANVQIWSTNGTSAQRWKVSTSSGVTTITNAGSGKALDVAGGSSSSGTNVWQYTSNGTAAQKWVLTMGTTGLMVSSKLGCVLDVAGGSTSNGANAQVWTSNGSAAQRWILTTGA